MVKTGKFTGLALTAAVASVLLIAGIAWACTPQPKIVALGIAAPTAGSEIEIAGDGLTSGTPVEIRWDSLAGPVVGSGKADPSGALSVKVTIPDVEPGIYHLMMQSPAASVARTPIEVSGSGSGQARGAAVNDLWSGYSSVSRTVLEGSAAEAASADGNRMAGLMLTSVGAVALAGAVFATRLAKRRRNI